MSEVIQHLLNPRRLYSRQEVVGRTSVVPAEPGIYAWYFASSPSNEIDLDKCWRWHDRHLLYVGISPKKPPKNGKPPSSQNIRKRVAYHMRGNAYGATLRLSIGSLVSELLGIELRRVGSGTRMTFSDGEAELSKWLDENAYVTWVSDPEPWKVEEEAISSLYLPLNLDQNSGHSFHGTLSLARKLAKQAAQTLPVIPR
jgi:GIY-YIG catalytic domain